MRSKEEIRAILKGKFGETANVEDVAVWCADYENTIDHLQSLISGNKSGDKWTMFKNFMHNELGVSKDDIRVWIREAVEEQVKHLVSQSFGKFDVKRVIDSIVYDKSYWGDKKLVEEIRQGFAKALIEKISITVR